MISYRFNLEDKIAGTSTIIEKFYSYLSWLKKVLGCHLAFFFFSVSGCYSSQKKISLYQKKDVTVAQRVSIYQNFNNTSHDTSFDSISLLLLFFWLCSLCPFVVNFFYIQMFSSRSQFFLYSNIFWSHFFRFFAVLTLFIFKYPLVAFFLLFCSQFFLHSNILWLCSLRSFAVSTFLIIKVLYLTKIEV